VQDVGVVGPVEQQSDIAGGLGLVGLAYDLTAYLAPAVASRKALARAKSMTLTGMPAALGLDKALVQAEGGAEGWAAFMAANPALFRLCFFEAPLSWQGAAFDPFGPDFAALRLDAPENLPHLRELVYTIGQDTVSFDDAVDFLLIRNMRRNWDQSTLFDTKYSVMDQSAAGTPEGYARMAEEEVTGFVLADQKLMQGRDPGTLSVLELGCGMGRLLRVLAGKFREVHGTDASRERHLESRYRLKDLANVLVTRNDGRSLAQYGDASFDVCFAHGVFVHIHSKGIIDNYIKELGRVLKQGGRVKFDIYHGKDVFGIGPRYFGVGARYDEDEIRASLAAGGLRPVDIGYLTYQQFERSRSGREYSRLGLKQMLVVAEKP